MAEPQSGVLPEGSRHAIFLTLLLSDGEEAARVLRRAAAMLPALTEELAKVDPAAGLVSSIGFGAGVWNRLFEGNPPASLRPFRRLEDASRRAPATPTDVLLHLRADRFDFCFDLARRFRAKLGCSVSVVEEVHGFRYLDSRDLTGFVDGTENPQGDHRAEVALVGVEDADFAGGSYVAVQRYVHDLAAWERLSVPEQEQIIARTKEDDIEFETDAKPPTAHIKRVNIKEDGKSLEILRHSMPYGTADEHGLVFIAYGSSPDPFDKMLAQMIVADEEGHYDHLMNFSRAVTGASFFVPARDWLERQGY